MPKITTSDSQASTDEQGIGVTGSGYSKPVLTPLGRIEPTLLGSPPDPPADAPDPSFQLAKRVLTDLSHSAQRKSAESLLQTTLAEGRRARLRVSGPCMAPLINDGDHVVVEGLAATPAAGSIVVARNADNAIICHRVLGADEDRVWLCGDRSTLLEDHSWHTIIGRVCSIDRGAKKLSLPDAPRRADSWLARLHLFALRTPGTFRGRVAGLLHRVFARVVNTASA